MLIQKQNKYKDVSPTAIDLFKELHCSSKTGFSEPVKEKIVSTCSKWTVLDLIRL
jgi:hypothetical protein